MGKETPAFGRILLKLSGEALKGEERSGLSPAAVDRIAGEIVEVHRLGVGVAVVPGGGNIFRGDSEVGSRMDRVAADHMGMLATVINSLALQDALEHQGVDTRVLTAVEIRQVAEPYVRRRAMRHLEKGRVVLIAGGTGNPYFTTDSAAALRAMEVRADILLKATQVDGVFDADPLRVPGARKVDEISYLDILDRGLKVMDSTAISLCMDHRMPILVFNLNRPGNIKRVVLGEKVGSVVRG
ncbi:MAG: UMP kinase [Acidobacteria bacterium]|nr:UMP kinase [Acidobacteriota bacterium]